MDLVACLFCGKTFTHDPFSSFCPDCGEPLFVAPSSGPGPKTIRADKFHPLEKFGDFLPIRAFNAALSLGEGGTPLVPLRKLGVELGLPGLFAKNEAQNPTGSFKDRGTAVAIQKAVALGFKKIGTVSTGNMAASTAAYGARAGLKTYVLLKEGTSRTSLQAAGIFGPTLVMVRGDYGRLFYRSLEVGKKLGIYFMNSIDAFRVEGYKVTGFEIFFQLDGRQAPRFVFVPLSSGGHLLGLMRAFEDLERAGLVRGYPTFVGVQAEGCAPLVRAFESGKPKYERLNEVRTIAHAISNPAPPAGNAVLKLIRDHEGILMSVSDGDMVAAQGALAASEGLFCQPESAVTLAGLLRLREKRIMPADGSSVLILTGSGLKTLQALDPLPSNVREIELDDLEQGLEDPA
ncbi:MAG: pyridoxal-phosphate dependent enzyme [Candidatus Aminicenantales bacterium]|jgi:threonine synthase